MFSCKLLGTCLLSSLSFIVPNFFFPHPSGIFFEPNTEEQAMRTATAFEEYAVVAARRTGTTHDYLTPELVRAAMLNVQEALVAMEEAKVIMTRCFCICSACYLQCIYIYVVFP